MDRIKAKQDIIDRVTGALDYLPDNLAEADLQKPWLATVLNMTLTGGVTYGDLSVYEINAANGLFGAPAATLLRGDGGSPGETDVEDPPVKNRLRAV